MQPFISDFRNNFKFVRFIKGKIKNVKKYSKNILLVSIGLINRETHLKYLQKIVNVFSDTKYSII